jgi:hypothetical protein
MTRAQGLSDFAAGLGNTLKVDDTNNRVGINSSIPTTTLDVGGSVTATSFVGVLTGNVTGNISGGTVAGSTGTFTGDVDIADKIIHTGDTNTAIRFPANDTFTVETAGSEAIRVDSSGRLLVGQTSAINGIFGSTPPRFSVSTTTASPSIFGTYSNNTYASRIDLVKSRSATVGLHTVVQAGDALGELYFGGSDGDQYQPAALIQSVVESGVGNNDMPADLRFFTNSGSTTVTEKLRIKSDGKFGFNTINPPRDYCFMSGQADTNIQITNSTTGVDDSAGALIQQDGNDLYIWNKENSFMSLGTNATEKVRITSAGEVRIANGNLKFTTAGKGIDFSATGDGTGTATSELLDDYEEGTFTPTAFIGTTALSVSGNTGTYTKVGNTVFFSCRLDSITKSGTGAFSIGGLPYTPLFSGNANKYNQPTVRFTGINPGGVLVPLFSPTGSQFIFFQSISTSGGLGNVTNTNLNSTCSIYGLSGFYTV